MCQRVFTSSATDAQWRGTPYRKSREVKGVCEDGESSSMLKNLTIVRASTSKSATK
jgi:hypothetical protein